jgi:hypothetical protein
VTDPAEVVIDTVGGRTFRASRRTWAHLDYTIEQLAQDAPTCSLRVIQGCYNTGVKQSAGTHDYDAVLDVEIVGMGWSNAQGFLRRCGWAAWWRQPPTFSNHIHMVSLGYPGQVGVYVPGQVTDYLQHRTGLAGHAADASWFPDDINSTVFDFDQWNEAHMPLNKDDLDKIRAVVVDVLKTESLIDVGKGRKWSVVTVLANLRTLVKGP